MAPVLVAFTGIFLFFSSRFHALQSLTHSGTATNKYSFSAPKSGTGRSLHHSRLGLGWGTILPPPLIHSVLRGQSSNGSGGGGSMAAGRQLFVPPFGLDPAQQYSRGRIQRGPSDRPKRGKVEFHYFSIGKSAPPLSELGGVTALVSPDEHSGRGTGQKSRRAPSDLLARGPRPPHCTASS